MKIEWLIEIVKKIRAAPTELEARGIFSTALDLEEETNKGLPWPHRVDSLLKSLGLEQKTVTP